MSFVHLCFVCVVSYCCVVLVVVCVALVCRGFVLPCFVLRCVALKYAVLLWFGVFCFVWYVMCHFDVIAFLRDVLSRVLFCFVACLLIAFRRVSFRCVSL